MSVEAPHVMLTDLWERLGRLHSCCDLEFHMRRSSDGSAWDMVVRLRSDPTQVLHVEADSLAELLSQAVAQAEERGWPNLRDGRHEAAG